MGFGFGITLTDAQQDRADEVAAMACSVLPSPGMVVLCLRCGLARVGVTRLGSGIQLTCTRCGQSVELTLETVRSDDWPDGSVQRDPLLPAEQEHGGQRSECADGLQP
jgi:hypothetical protein